MHVRVQQETALPSLYCISRGYCSSSPSSARSSDNPPDVVSPAFVLDPLVQCVVALMPWLLACTHNKGLGEQLSPRAGVRFWGGPTTFWGWIHYESSSCMQFGRGEACPEEVISSCNPQARQPNAVLDCSPSP